jgi:hypothetical protein
MTRFDGRGLLRSFSCEINLELPVYVRDVPALLGLPKDYASNLIVVRGTRKLDANELINNGEEIILFLAAMGG